LTDVVYRVQRSPRAKPQTVNRYRIWKVSGRLPDDWWTGPGEATAAAAARPENLAPPADDEPAHLTAAGGGDDDDDDDDGIVAFRSLPLPSVADQSPEEAEGTRGPSGRVLAPGDEVVTSRSGRKIRRPLRYRDSADAEAEGTSLGGRGAVSRIAYVTAALSSPPCRRAAAASTRREQLQRASDRKSRGDRERVIDVTISPR
jgi:hypothetical protein